MTGSLGVDALVAVTLVLTAAVQGAIGFGMNLLAVPVLLVLAPELVPGPLIVGTFSLVLVSVLRERGHVDRAVGWALLGRLPGTALAVLVLTRLTSQQLRVPLAVLVLLAVVVTALPVRVRPTRTVLLAAGAVSGFSGTVSSIGGPPIALVYARASGPQLRGTLSAFFLAGTVISLVALTLSGQLDAAGYLRGLLLVPPVVLGVTLARPLSRHLDAGRTRPAVLLLASLSGVLALAEALRG